MSEKKYDVIVCGAGVAGIAAALAARRCGCDTLLVEKECLPGGLATLGLIAYYLPLCDGRGTQIIGGISEELLRLSIRYGCDGRYPKPWLEGGSQEERTKHRFEAQFNPQWFALLAEDMMVREGVILLYDSRIIGVDTADGDIQSIQVANKGGTQTLRARVFVDATGDADVVAMAGERTALFSDNRPAAWYYCTENGKMDLRMMGLADITDGQMVQSFAEYSSFTGMDPWQNSDALVRGHRQILADLASRRSTHPDIAPATLPGILQIRMSRRLEGAYTLDEGKREDFDDCVGMMGSWREPGPIHQIPYRCLYGDRIHNLLAAGRCISAAGAMWDLTRVIPVAALTGQIAGTAAALCSRDDIAVSALGIDTLRQALTS